MTLSNRGLIFLATEISVTKSSKMSKIDLRKWGKWSRGAALNVNKRVDWKELPLRNREHEPVESLNKNYGPENNIWLPGSTTGCLLTRPSYFIYKKHHTRMLSSWWDISTTCMSAEKAAQQAIQEIPTVHWGKVPDPGVGQTNQKWSINGPGTHQCRGVH